MVNLMIKQHNATGLKYLHKSSVHTSEEYIGSGTRWKGHIKKYGPDVTTLWEESFHEDEVEEIALFLSEQLNVVESDEWANYIPENGLDGRPKGCLHSEETKRKMSFAKMGKKRHEEFRKLKSKQQTGKGNSFYGKSHKADFCERQSERMTKAQVGAGNTNAKSIRCDGEVFGTMKMMSEKTGVSMYLIHKMIKNGEAEVINGN